MSKLTPEQITAREQALLFQLDAHLNGRIAQVRANMTPATPQDTAELKTLLDAVMQDKHRQYFAADSEAEAERLRGEIAGLARQYRQVQEARQQAAYVTMGVAA